MGVIAKKLTDEELQSVKNIRQEYNSLALAFGELELQKLSLVELQKELIAKETQLAQKLQEKYGQGTIDLDTGEIKV